MCGTMGFLFHVWGGVSVGLFFFFFFFFLVISICTVFVLFWEGNWNNLQLNNCFWKIWWPFSGPGRSKTRPDWMVTEEAAAAAVEAVLKW